MKRAVFRLLAQTALNPGGTTVSVATLLVTLSIIARDQGSSANEAVIMEPAR